jgi:hypothetical protein
MSKYGAEFFGTFWLVLGGCGSAVLAAAFPNVGIGLLGVSLAFPGKYPTRRPSGRGKSRDAGLYCSVHLSTRSKEDFQ